MYRLAWYAHSFLASRMASRVTALKSTLAVCPTFSSSLSTTARRTRGMHPWGMRIVWFLAHSLMKSSAFWNASCRIIGGWRSCSVSVAPSSPAGGASS